MVYIIALQVSSLPSVSSLLTPRSPPGPTCCTSTTTQCSWSSGSRSPSLFETPANRCPLVQVDQQLTRGSTYFVGERYVVDPTSEFEAVDLDCSECVQQDLWFFLLCSSRLTGPHVQVNEGGILLGEMELTQEIPVGYCGALGTSFLVNHGRHHGSQYEATCDKECSTHFKELEGNETLGSHTRVTSPI